MSHLIILGLSLLVMIVLVRLKVELGLAMLASAVLLGFLGRLTPLTLARTLGSSWVEATALNLLASLLAIRLLENVLRKQGYLQKVLSSLRALFADSGVVMALCPAFLGLLPSAGGAVLSAPMVEEAAAGKDLSAEDKSVVNYWYRHIWEYSLPLYPGIILAAKFVAIPLTRLMFLLFPFTVLKALLGIPVALGPIKKKSQAKMTKALPSVRKRELRNLLVGISPVLLVIAAVVGLGVEVWLAVLGVIVGLLILHRCGIRKILAYIREALSLRTTLLVAGVMAFRGMLGATGLVTALPKIFTVFGFPPLAMIILFPLTMGLLIGLGQGFVAASFPLLIGLLGTGADARLGLVVLAFVSGFVGVMLTPLHFCFVLTVQFFQADLGKVWRRIAPAMAGILLLAIPYGLWVIR